MQSPAIVRKGSSNSTPITSPSGSTATARPASTDKSAKRKIVLDAPASSKKSKSSASESKSSKRKKDSDKPRKSRKKKKGVDPAEIQMLDNNDIIDAIEDEAEGITRTFSILIVLIAVQTKKRSKKEVAEQRITDDRLETSMHVVTLMSTLCIGEVTIPLSRLQNPSKDISARVVDKEHVEKLMTSMCNFGVREKDLHITVAVRHQAAKQCLRELTAISDREERSARFLALADEHGFKFETITGQHTRTAMQRLGSRFPRNPKYVSAPVTVYIMEPTPENRMALAHYGVTDNNIRAVHKGMVMVDYVENMHQLLQDYKVESREGKGDMSQNDFLRHFTRLGIRVDTARGYFYLASLPPRSYELMRKILRDEVEMTKRKNWKQVKGYYWFTPFRNSVPDHVIEKWLGFLVDGTIGTTAQYELRCKRYILTAELTKLLLNTHYGEEVAPQKTLKQLYTDLPGSQGVFTKDYFLSFYGVCWVTKTTCKVPESVRARFAVLVAELAEAHQRNTRLPVCMYT